MLAADIILVCSRNEAFGRVVVEGMKLGRPVIYSRSGGIPEYMNDGVTGLSYAPGDANELIQRIEELLDDPERAAGIGAEAKRHACAKFTRNDSDFRILKDLKERRGRSDWRVAMPRDVVASLTSVAVQAPGLRDQLRTAIPRSFALARAISWPLRWLMSRVRGYALRGHPRYRLVSAWCGLGLDWTDADKSGRGIKKGQSGQPWRKTQGRRRGTGPCPSTYGQGSSDSRVDNDDSQVCTCGESL